MTGWLGTGQRSQMIVYGETLASPSDIFQNRFAVIAEARRDPPALI